MKKVLVLAGAFVSFFSMAQTDVVLHFPPKVGGNDLVQNTIVQSLGGVDMSIDYFNYYISNVHIIHDGGQDLNLSDTVFIVKIEDHTLDLGMLDVTNIESIDFGVGVPQSVNHADISQYTEDNPLSWQSPSMHWGWSSGYKLLLVNGFGDSNNDGTPDELMQIHSLGDANYKYVSMAVIPTVSATNITIVINCNLDEWLFGVDPGSVGVHHSTTGVNASVMNNVDNRPVFTLPGNASLDNSLEASGTITYAIIGESISFKWKDVQNVDNFRLIDLTGKEIDAGKASEFTGTHSSEVMTSGSYFFYLLDSNGSIIKHIQVIR
ncbi:MAG: hypothetical protein HRT58_13900 [Crocinitomicaceae bacterium]|nr:hypothetical protein [Flavobacteriales bacterium]NQZ36759.1 hypothetical protein [Crocinitomicaceae bacterium]